MAKLREGAKRHSSAVVEAPKIGPAQVKIQEPPQMTCGLHVGAHEPGYTRWPGPAVPPPLNFIESLSKEQRRALMAKLECGLPDDMDKLRKVGEFQRGFCGAAAG